MSSRSGHTVHDHVHLAPVQVLFTLKRAAAVLFRRKPLVRSPTSETLFRASTYGSLAHGFEEENRSGD
jgi:hypothetical protein